MQMYDRHTAPQVSAIVEKAMNYIHAYYTEKELSLKPLAAALYVNPSYISNRFRRELNMTVTDYIIMCRMVAAAHMLCNTSFLKMSDIAERVGYRDPLYFSRRFKKFFGISPRNYLNAHSGAHE